MRKTRSFFTGLLLAVLLLALLGACGKEPVDETVGGTDTPAVTLPAQTDEPETYPITQEDQNGDGMHDGDAAILQGVIDQFPEIYPQGEDVQYRVTVENMATWVQIEESTDAPKRAVSINWREKELWGHLSLAGLDALKDVWIADGNYLTTIDLTGCARLQEVNVGHNRLLESITLTGCTALKNLNVAFNSLRTLDLSSCAALEVLICENNMLTELDVSVCPELHLLQTKQNMLTELNVLSNTKLTSLNCGGNNLSSLDVTGVPLKELNVTWNVMLGLEYLGEGNEVQFARVGTGVTGLSPDAVWTTQEDILDYDMPFNYVPQNHNLRTEEDADWVNGDHITGFLDQFRV